MIRKPQTIAGKLAVFSLAFLVLAGIFYWVVAEDWSSTAVETDAVTPGTPVGIAGDTVAQTFTVPVDWLERIQIMPERVSHDPGTVRISLTGEDGQLLYEKEMDAENWVSGQMTTIPLEPAVVGWRGQRAELRLEIREAGLSFWSGDSVGAGRFEARLQTQDRLTVAGQPEEGKLVLKLAGKNEIAGRKWFWPVAGVIWLALLAGYGHMLRCRMRGKPHPLLRLYDMTVKYQFLMKQLVSRDFKVKYKASVFGFLWSFLNPLLMMGVYYFVFSTIFRSNIPNFPVYLMTGIVLFNFFSDATNLGLLSITGNAHLITKVYIPKYIFPVSKVLSSAVNLLISLVPLLLMMLLTGMRFTKALLLLPFVVAFLIMLTTGVSLILSSMTVFFRDTQFLWGILITIINFMTPIFYPESIIPEVFRTIYHINPLYQIVYFMRCITIGGISPTPVTYLYCILVSAIPLALGLWIFRKQQDKFVLYL